MENIFIGIAMFLCQPALAQSPTLSLKVRIDSLKAESTRYKIEMKICEPKKMTDRGDWFSHDTSTIEFASLKANNIDCGGYFSSDEGLIQLSGERKKEVINSFEYNGQLFTWEKIFVFKISNISSRAWWPEMYIVLPMKYKSFFTHVELTDLEFQSGKVIWLSDYNSKMDGSRQTINQSLKDKKGIEEKIFVLKDILR